MLNYYFTAILSIIFIIVSFFKNSNAKVEFTELQRDLYLTYIAKNRNLWVYLALSTAISFAITEQLLMYFNIYSTSNRAISVFILTLLLLNHKKETLSSIPNCDFLLCTKKYRNKEISLHLNPSWIDDITDTTYIELRNITIDLTNQGYTLNISTPLPVKKYVKMIDNSNLVKKDYHKDATLNLKIIISARYAIRPIKKEHKIRSDLLALLIALKNKKLGLIIKRFGLRFKRQWVLSNFILYKNSHIDNSNT